MPNDADAGEGRPAATWTEYYRRQTAMLTRLADRQAARADKVSALIDSGRELSAELGIEAPIPLVAMMRDAEQHTRLGAQVCAAWTLAAADFTANGGPSNPAAAAAWRAACDWYGALVADGRT
jgi:hypothetical protein